MKRFAAIVCVVLLAMMSVFIFPVNGPALPGTSILDDIPKSEREHQEEPAKDKPKEDIKAELGTHPMDAVIEKMTLEERCEGTCSKI